MSDELGQAILPTLVAAPLLGAALAFALGRRHAARIAGLVVAIISCASAALLGQVWRVGELRLALGGWSPPLGINLVADGVSAILIATTTIVGAAISVHASAYLREHDFDQDEPWLLWPLWLCCWAGINGALLSGDLFNLYVAIELVGLAAIALVAFSGGDALVAALRYVLVTMSGSMLYLLGVALIYADYGLVDIATLAELIHDRPATQVAVVLMTAGLLLKAAIVPLHAWLAPAHSGAIAPISAVLSSLVVEVFFYVLLRLWLELFPALINVAVAEALGLLGVAAIVWGSVQALARDRLKLLVAYSTVAQLGYLMLGFPLAAHDPLGAAAWSGVVVFVAAHAPAKAASFLAAGDLDHALGDDRLATLRGAAHRAPTTALAFALASVALIGLPPSGTFVGKWLLLTGSLAAGRWIYVAAIAGGSLLAAAYSFRVLALTLREPDDQGPASKAPATMRSATFVLALVSAALGLVAHPMLTLLEAGAVEATTGAR